MIGIIIAFLLGYWLGEKNQPKPKKYTSSIEYNEIDYGYVKDGESIKDLT